MSRKIIYKTPEQIANIRIAGRYLTELLLLIENKAQPGISGLELETRAQEFMDHNNIIGTFKGYNWFPANLCISINDCIVHGIPDETILQEGDLVKIDAGVTYKWGISDSAISFIVGWATHNPKWQYLIDTTKWALDHSLSCVKPWLSIFTFGKAVHEYIIKRKCNIIKNLTWHGVGVELHEAPSIYNWPNGAMQQTYFQPNMIVALEPITALKSSIYKEKPWIPWNLYTKKWDLGAQREYTVLITEDGYEILAGVV